MARVRPKSEAELAAARISGADLLVVTWLYRRLDGRLDRVPRGAHWDVCAPDLTLSSATFDVGVGGGCPTCEYTYTEARLTLSCSCGARVKTFELNVSGLDQGAILAELAALAAELELDAAAASGAASGVVAELADVEQRRAADDLYDLRYRDGR